MPHVLLALLLSTAEGYSILRGHTPSVTQQVSVRALCAMQADEAEESEPAAEAIAGPPPMPELVAEPVDGPSVADPFDSADEESIAKEALKAEVGEGLSSASPDKVVVGEILLALEAMNPTRSPATSPLLNGKWKVIYASGSSPGLKATQLLLKGAKNAPKSPSGADLIDVQDVYITIGQEQPRAEASLRTRLLSFENTVKLSSRLEAESAVRLVETYEAAESEYLSLRLPFQSPVQYKRSLLVSYLDEELLVVRDALGRPDVLMRCDGPSASLESDTADDSVPGAS
eukprot:CAMPEP_0119320914 /NCGR_PEP_ID=MMETSP1333-20130426/53890_1 /TAXON_ID=418940 /ORGANISM="Scyphosphaera apsteinii, Strain RCC1455" /LENGTH=286 /DNA_ID=CAMNT_0007327749 /DNA_START=31 /DNA_END=891 /DNA_ORIENTATION=-